MDKPVTIFNRDREWAALAGFASDPQPGATLGVVCGQRRQGKTFLLEALCRQAGGFYFGATEAADAESLRRIGTALTEHVRPPAAFHFADWAEAFDVLLWLGRDKPLPVVIDEFPYLARANPQLPSLLQDALRPLRARNACNPVAASCCAARRSRSWDACSPETHRCVDAPGSTSSCTPSII